MKTYEPNFNDPRIRARALKCLNYVELYLPRESNVVWIARDTVYEHFSDTSRPLGRWLKNLVLITQDDYFNFQTGQCKRYRRNAAGVVELKRLLGIDNFEPRLSAELEQQVTSGEFEYTQKSNRLFNPVQFIPRERRESILANHGYRHNYDIKGAAPRLLMQRAQQIDHNFTAPALAHYIRNTTQVREQIAHECSIAASDVKAIVNAMLHGAYISKNSHSQILQQLNYDYTAIDQLKACELVQNLRDDIRGLWQTLRVLFPERYTTNRRGNQYLVRLTGRDKSGLYRQLESDVAKSIRRYLKRHSVRHLWIHDGWCSDQVVDMPELCSQVKRQTGFVIELDWAVYE